MKSPTLKIRRDERRACLGGALEFENATSALADSRGWLDDVDTVDLGELTMVDTAGLALLLLWKRRRPSLRFAAVPEDLCSLARLSGVDDLLGMTTGQPPISEGAAQSTSIS